MLAVLVGIVVWLAAAFVVRRLLGIARGRWFITVVAVFLCTTAADALLRWAFGSEEAIPVLGIVAGWALVVVFSMLLILLVELLLPDRAQRRGGIPRPVRAARQWGRRSSRYVEVVGIVARSGLLRRGDDEAGSRLGRSLRTAFEQAGGLFVKLGQAMAQQPHLVTRPVADELAMLQEQAAPADPAGALAVIADELGDPALVFAEICPTPLGAASIGQTYLARLPDGREVVVKVQRPGVGEAIACDLDILERLARRLHNRTAWARSIGLRELVAGFDERTREELDFRIEAAAGTAARRALLDAEPIHVPAVVDGLTTARVMVQERAAGQSIGAPGALAGLDPDRRRSLADALLALMLRQLLAGEPFHADPHPGNVFIRPDGELVLIDFGSVGRLDPYERAGLIDLLRGLHSQNPATLRAGVLRIGTTTRRIDDDAVDRELARLLVRAVLPGGTLNPELFNELLVVLREFGILLPRSATTLFRTLVTLLGTLQLLSPGYPALEAAARLGRRVIGEQTAAGSPADMLRSMAMDNVTVLQRAPQHLDSIAWSLVRGDLRTRVSLLSEPEDVRVLTGLANRVLIVAIGAALALASAIMLALDSPPVNGLRLINILGGIGLFFAVLLLLRVLVVILRERG